MFSGADNAPAFSSLSVQCPGHSALLGHLPDWPHYVGHSSQRQARGESLGCVLLPMGQTTAIIISSETHLWHAHLRHDKITQKLPVSPFQNGYINFDKRRRVSIALFRKGRNSALLVGSLTQVKSRSSVLYCFFTLLFYFDIYFHRMFKPFML